MICDWDMWHNLIADMVNIWIKRRVNYVNYRLFPSLFMTVFVIIKNILVFCHRICHPYLYMCYPYVMYMTSMYLDVSYIFFLCRMYKYVFISVVDFTCLQHILRYHTHKICMVSYMTHDDYLASLFCLRPFPFPFPGKCSK